VPTSIAVPALVAAAAYINARCQVYYDLHMLESILPTVTRSAWWKMRGRLNTFYRLEALATSKSPKNRVFLRFEDKIYTYTQAYDNFLRYSVWLKEHDGIKKGELVALDFQNTDTPIFLLFAVWSLGAIFALINYSLSGNPLAHCV
jgi:acyl-coenzyme A synthetase/AMP-(fatty) acid ligase